MGLLCGNQTVIVLAVLQGPLMYLPVFSIKGNPPKVQSKSQRRPWTKNLSMPGPPNGRRSVGRGCEQLWTGGGGGGGETLGVTEVATGELVLDWAAGLDKRVPP